jgi:hypothetical protein
LEILSNPVCSESAALSAPSLCAHWHILGKVRGGVTISTEPLDNPTLRGVVHRKDLVTNNELMKFFSKASLRR